MGVAVREEKCSLVDLADTLMLTMFHNTQDTHEQEESFGLELLVKI